MRELTPEQQDFIDNNITLFGAILIETICTSKKNLSLSEALSYCIENTGDVAYEKHFKDAAENLKSHLEYLGIPAEPVIISLLQLPSQEQ